MRVRLRLLPAIVAAALTLAAATAAAAPPAPASSPAAGVGQVAPPGSDGFEAVPPGQPVGPPDTLPAPTLVATAYGAIWLVLLVYLTSLWRRGRRLAAEIEDLRRRLELRARNRVSP